MIHNIIRLQDYTLLCEALKLFFNFLCHFFSFIIFPQYFLWFSINSSLLESRPGCNVPFAFACLFILPSPVTNATFFANSITLICFNSHFACFYRTSYYFLLFFVILLHHHFFTLPLCLPSTPPSPHVRCGRTDPHPAPSLPRSRSPQGI